MRQTLVGINATWLIGRLALLPAGTFVISLALRVESWRTGEPVVLPLALRPGYSGLEMPTRIWIDTDAACGLGITKDPDDCFATFLLAKSIDCIS